MTDDPGQKEKQKKAIFDSMSKRGQKYVMRIGYENWDPFQEPKDPREAIFGQQAMTARGLIQEFYETHPGAEEIRAQHYELLQLIRGILKKDIRATAIFDFCHWYGKKRDQEKP